MSINVSTIEKKTQKKVQDSSLTIRIKGKDVNPNLINSIRRIACDEIPTYAIPKGFIDIEHNTSIAFNNDYMRNRLSTLPISYPVSMYYLEPKYFKIKDTDMKEKRENISPEEKDIKLYINEYNNSSEMKNITTNHLITKVDDKDYQMFQKDNPILLIKLNPGETFKCTMKAVLGKGYINSNWKAAKNAYHKYNEENDIMLTVESHRKFTEKEILQKSCKFLLHKIQLVKKDILELLEKNKEEINKVKKDDNDFFYFVVLNWESHTIGIIFNYELQSHPDIIFSACVKRDNLVEDISLKFKTKNNQYPEKILNDVVNSLDKKIKTLEKEINKI
jgi:DNA-directed RNA polymerase subunit L